MKWYCSGSFEDTWNEQDSEKSHSLKENVYSPWHFLPHDLRPEELMSTQTQSCSADAYDRTSTMH